MEIRSVGPDIAAEAAYTAERAFDVEKGGWADGWVKRSNSDDGQSVWAVFEGPEIVSACVSAPEKVFYTGMAIQGGFVGGVGTPPEHRRKGYAEALMRQVATGCRDRGILISHLWPFSYRYYRKAGWEHSCDRVHYVLDRSLLNTLSLSDAHEGRRLLVKDAAGLSDLWNSDKCRWNGPTVRHADSLTESSSDFDNSDSFLSDGQSEYAIGIFESNSLIAYGWIDLASEEKRVLVREAAFNGQAALEALLKYAISIVTEKETLLLDLPVDYGFHLFLKEQRVIRNLEAGHMAKIMDYRTYFTQISWQQDSAFTLNLTIDDPVFGKESMRLDVADGRAEVGASKAEGLSIPSGLACQLVTGYLDAETAVLSGLIDRSHLKAFRQLASASNGQKPYRSSKERG